MEETVAEKRDKFRVLSLRVHTLEREIEQLEKKPQSAGRDSVLKVRRRDLEETKKQLNVPELAPVVMPAPPPAPPTRKVPEPEVDEDYRPTPAAKLPKDVAKLEILLRAAYEEKEKRRIRRQLRKLRGSTRPRGQKGALTDKSQEILALIEATKAQVELGEEWAAVEALDKIEILLKLKVG